jgi:hypothetical protein
MGSLRIERVTWAERALWAALVVVSIAPTALRPGAEELVRAYLAAVDRGDVDAALELTARDFVLRPVLGEFVYGRETVRDALEYRVALNERWRVIGWEYDRRQREVHAEFLVTSDAWDLVGSRPTVGVVYVVRDSRLLIERVRTGAREARRDLRPFLDWASVERPRELAVVWRDGRPLRNPEAARHLLALLREWRAVREPLADGAESPQG